MKALTHMAALERVKRPMVLAVGFFDGLHRGHQRVLRRALACARRLGGEAWVLSFDRHPRSVVAPGRAPRLLTSVLHRRLLFERLGMDGCLLIPFDARAARQAPDAFARRLCAAAPMLRAIFAGRDWRFGHGGAGNLDLLRRLARERGIRVVGVPPLKSGGRAVSSTRIREAIEAGRLADAARLLGRPFSVMGRVTHGRAVGRRMGFPTANLATDHELLPPAGVYAAEALVAGTRRTGVLNLGRRPTFASERPAAKPTLELHVLDFDGSLYGRRVEVFFRKRLRNERRFADVAALRSAIAKDARRARLLLAGSVRAAGTKGTKRMPLHARA